MLKAGSLLYAIFISFLLSALASVYLLVSHYNQLYALRDEGRVKAIHHLNSAINLLLVNEEEIEGEYRQLYREDDFSRVKITATPWGLYQLLKTETVFQQDTFQKAAIAGNAYHKAHQLALYLSDRNQPLSIAGESRIIGDAMLSERGLKRAFIEGKSFSGSELLKGQRLRSQNSLPAIRKESIESIEDLTWNGIHSKADTVYYFEQASDQAYINIQRSAHQSQLQIYSPNPIYLNAGRLQGPILLRSDQEVVIGSEFLAEDILIAAPYIQIEDGFQGSLQAVVSDTLILGKNVQLDYPSALVVYSENNQSLLEMQEGSTVWGEVISIYDERVNAISKINILEGAKVYGSVYASNNLNHRGEVYGTTACKKFYLKTTSSIYENHLLDAVLDFQSLPKAYVGSGFISEWCESNKAIIKWLD